MDAKYLAEIKARDSAELPETAAPVFRDRHALLAEVERLTTENEKMKPFYKIADDTFKHWEHAAYAMRDEERACSAAKDQQTATLSKALKLACDSKFRYMPKPDYFIQQAQGQEAEK